MYLLIDGQALQTPDSRNRGIGRYSRNLVTALAAQRPHWHIELVQSSHLEPIDGDAIPGVALRAFTPPLTFLPENREANERYFGDWLSAQRPDVLLELSFFELHAVLPRFIGARPPLAAVAYDLIPLLLHQHYLTDETTLTHYGHCYRQMAAADCLLAISQATAADVQALLPDWPRVVAVGGAPDPTLAPLGDAELNGIHSAVRERFDLNRPFLLYVGGFDPRKNMDGALRAFAALPAAVRDQYDFVIACQLNDHERRELADLGQRLGIDRAVKLTGYVSDAELRALYQLCRGNRSSLPEVAGAVSWLADPDSPADLARAILAALAQLREAGAQDRLDHVAGFNWERTAEIACEALVDTLRPPLQPKRRRRRIAWVSPLPPSHSGIADYSANLLQPLAERFEIDAIVDPQQPPVQDLWSGQCRVLTPDQAVARHGAEPYDLFVQHIGNSAFHVYQLDLLWRFGGLVVLHDYFLNGLVSTAAQAGSWPVSLDQELDAEGEADAAEMWRQRTPHVERRISQTSLNRRVLSAADAVLTHSLGSWTKVKSQVAVPVAHIPMFVRVPPTRTRHDARLQLKIPNDVFLICTLGIVAPVKRIEAIVRAVAGLPDAMRRRTRLDIVGEINEYHVHDWWRWQELTRELGIDDAVRWLGRVPFDELSTYARAADVCIQLRYPMRGESSGVVPQALAAGAACIVSDQGSMAELPDDVAWKVRSPDHEVAGLLAALQRLYHDRTALDILGRNARRYVQEHLDPDRVAEQYASFIEQTICARDRADTGWRERVCESLARCSDSRQADAMLAYWAALREQGRRSLIELSSSSQVTSAELRAA